MKKAWKIISTVLVWLANDGVYTHKEGKYNISMKFSSDAQGNDLDRATVYLVMVENPGPTETKYSAIFTLGVEGNYEPIEKSYEVGAGKQADLYFFITRMNPNISNKLMAANFEAEAEQPESATDDDNGNAAGTTGATTETAAVETTAPSETTSVTEETPIPDVDATTAPTTTPTGVPTEPVTEPEETTSPSETG